MSTGDRRVDIYLKKFLPQQQVTENFFDYLENLIRDNLKRVFPENGVFNPNILFTNILSSSAPNTFNIAIPLEGTDGPQGNQIVLDPLDSSLIPFQNQLGVQYHVGLRSNRLPRETEINVRTGEIKYIFLEEAVGELADPISVIDNGNETLTLNVNSVCESGVSFAGRKVIVWLKRALSQVQAFEEVTVTWDGVNNKIQTLTALGQTLGNISTDPSDYQVFLRGPTVRRNTDLRLDDNILFLGIVTGAGSGNTPSSFNHSDVNNLSFSVGALTSLFGEEHSLVDGTHTIINAEKIFTKQSIPGVQFDTRVNASDQNNPDVPVTHTLFPSSGGSGLQGIKWRLRNAAGTPIAYIDAHGNAYFQNIAAVQSVFQSQMIVQGNSVFGDNINSDVVTFNSVLQSLTDFLFVIDSDNNGTGHAYKFFNHSTSTLNEIFRISETGLVRFFGNLETLNTTLGIDLDSDNNATGEMFQITKNGGISPLLQLLETGVLRLFDKIITPNASFGIDLDNDANSTGESFSFTKNNFAQTLWLLNEFGDALSTRDTLTGASTAYKKADTTVITANASLNETHDESLFRKLLKVTANNPNNKAINIAPSRITAADGSDFVLPTGVVISNYLGGTANFQTGAQTGGGSGFTPINFAGQASKWAKYSLNLLADNTLLVLAATGFGTTKANAPNPPLARSAIAFTVVAVQDNGSAGIGTINNISETNFDRIPAAGGGGSGSGDANSFFEDLKRRLEDGFFEWVTPNIFSIHENNRVHVSSTATYDIANQVYKFASIGQVLLSIQHYGARFLGTLRENNKIELHAQWNVFDSLAIYEVSQDGGVNWSQITVDRVGDSKKVRGIVTLPDPVTLSSLLTYSVLNADSNRALNTTTDQQLAFSFVVPSGEKWRGIRLTEYFNKQGSLNQGSLFTKVVKDSSGLPSTNAADLISIAPVINIPNMASIGIISQQPNFPAGQAFATSGSFQHWAQRFTLSQSTLITTILAKMTKIGTINLGNLIISLVKDNGAGKPSTNPIDYIVTTGPLPVAPIVVIPGSSDYTLNVNQTLIAGTYHIVFETDATYKANANLFNTISVRRDSSIATNVHQEFNGSVWSDASPGQLYYVVNGAAANVDQQINFKTILPQGTYWVVFETDAAYKSIFSSGVNELRLRTDVSAPTYAGALARFNGTVWSAVSGEDVTFLLEGIKYDLRVRITSGSINVNLEGYGVFYGETGPSVSSDDRAIQTFYFSGNLDQTQFVVSNFLPDPALLKIYDVNSGQVYRYPAFSIDGHKIVFAAGTFLSPGETITLIADQSDGSGFDNSDFNASLLAANHLGSTDGSVDRSTAGRGIILRRPDGTLREISIDDSDNIVVSTVP